MQRILVFMTWAFLTVVILMAALGGAQPVFVQSPGIALALGMIGLGLCKHARERAAVAAQSTETLKPVRSA